MRQGKLLYEGKAKKIYETDDPRVLWAEFKDAATAFDGLKKGTIEKKGVFNAALSARLFALLEKNGVKTHFISQPHERSLLVRALKMYPIEVVMRNRVAGSIEKRYNLPHGMTLKKPILEYYLKNDDLHDPMLNRSHVVILGYLADNKLAKVEAAAFDINRVLKAFLKRRGFDLVDFKLEFGEYGGRIYLGDEISPDTCRIWDASTGEVFDKDRFRQDMGEVESHYAEVLRRLTA